MAPQNRDGFGGSGPYQSRLPPGVGRLCIRPAFRLPRDGARVAEEFLVPHPAGRPAAPLAFLAAEQIVHQPLRFRFEHGALGLANLEYVVQAAEPHEPMDVRLDVVEHEPAAILAELSAEPDEATDGRAVERLDRAHVEPEDGRGGGMFRAPGQEPEVNGAGVRAVGACGGMQLHGSRRCFRGTAWRRKARKVYRMIGRVSGRKQGAAVGVYLQMSFALLRGNNF